MLDILNQKKCFLKDTRYLLCLRSYNRNGNWCQALADVWLEHDPKPTSHTKWHEISGSTSYSKGCPSAATSIRTCGTPSAPKDGISIPETEQTKKYCKKILVTHVLCENKNECLWRWLWRNYFRWVQRDPMPVHMEQINRFYICSHFRSEWRYILCPNLCKKIMHYFLMCQGLLSK